MVSALLREPSETFPVLGGGGSSSLGTVGHHLPIPGAGTRAKTAPASEPQHRVAQKLRPPWHHGTAESAAPSLSPLHRFFLEYKWKIRIVCQRE